MRARVGGVLAVLFLGAAGMAPAAQAEEARLPKPPVGIFVEPKGLAVDQGSHDIYTIDGRSEVQRIKVSATSGKYKLKFGGGESGELEFSAEEEEVRTALRNLICGGGACVSVIGGPGNATGSNPFTVRFQNSLDTTEVEQIECLNGTLSGGSGCSVETVTNGFEGTIKRYHPDGTPSNFAALGSNSIDGKGGADTTPQGGLHFATPLAVQLAIDESGGATDASIYATQFGDHLVDVFGAGGEFKGQLTEYKDGAVFKPLNNVCGVAVDPSGNVYVADFSTGIHKYDPAGAVVSNADSVATFTTVPFPCTLAAGAGPTTGVLFANNIGGSLFKLDAAGDVKYKVSDGNTTVTVDSTSGHVLTAASGEAKVFDASGESATLIESIAAGSSVTGVGVDGTTGKNGTVYLSREKVTHLDVYGPLVEVPVVETRPPFEVGGTQAILKGKISADGGPNATCHFEYLTEATFKVQEEAAKNAGEPKTKEQIASAAFAGAASAPCEPPGPFSGSSVNDVSGQATGLTIETKYVFRLVGENANGSIPGSSESFETGGKPLVSGGSASQITATGALLSGSVDPRGSETEASFEYVTEEQFKASEFAGATVAAAPSVPPLVSGTGNLAAATGTANLDPGSTVITTFTTETGAFEAGEAISGAGLALGTEITAITALGSIVLSKPIQVGGTAVPLTATSNRVTGLKTTAGRFGPGQSISGPGIQPGTTVLAAQAGQLTLSKAATERIIATTLSANGPQPVSVQLNGLNPETTYFFRLVAESEAGAAEPGEAKSFSTFAQLGDTPLLDGRAYEMVTPVVKAGELFVPEPHPRLGLGGNCQDCTPGFDKERMPMQASPDGAALAFEGNPFAAGLASGSNEYVARRGQGGWGTAFLSKPSYRDDIEVKQGFKAFSADLSRAVVLQAEPSLSEEAPPDFANLYLQEEGKEALGTLITTEPPDRDPGVSGENIFRINYGGANAGAEGSAAMSHVIFQANDALTPEDPGIAPQAPVVTAAERNLYEWREGEGLHLVNVLPGNAEAAANAVIGSGLLSGPGANFNFDHAISDDGSRIFWSKVPSGQVYVREGGTSTSEIPDPGKFLTASADGSKALLSDGMVYDLEDEVLTDLSEGQGGFQGIAGTSEDLSRVYFVDTKALAGSAEEGKPNLYLWEEGEVAHEGTLSLIATLLASDNFAGLGGELGIWHAAPGDRLAQATADGRFLAFESRAPLTGYDNRIREGAGCLSPAKEGIPQCFEVFEYDAQTQTLACPSCNPSGERPLGASNLALINGEEEFFAQPQNLPPEGAGRLFFESKDALVQSDANGHIQDVYEWEPNGVGDCERARGCLALISNGRSPKDSHFQSAGADGNDVFFDTREQLVSADQDELLDIYDARVGGGFEEGPVPCEGESCAGPIPSPPPFEAPSSSQTSPEAPVRTPHCRRGFVRRHGKCVRKTHRKPHKHRHRHGRHQRGGSR